MSYKRSFDEYKSGLAHLPRSTDMDTDTDTVPGATTPPLIQGPTANEKKYDRQLRLWGAAGQRALEKSHVLLIIGDEVGSNSSVAGAETLKNLILPSIGCFTILDGAVVSDADLGVNFFLEPSSLGKSRAEEMTRLLQELNPDVNGVHIAKPLSEWLVDDVVLLPYHLIIVCAPIPTEQLERLSSYALNNDVPLIYVHSVGFDSFFSIQVPAEFPVVDTHPDPDSTQDLRLLAPWPELEAAADELGDLTSMSDHDHGHIPYILILLHCLKIWKTRHDGKPPSNFKEKTEFRDLVKSLARTNNAEGGEENFDEASAAVLKSINPPSVGSGFRELSTMTSCTNLSATSANFWIIAHAIHRFYATHSVLPLPGSLPDMKATSADYIKLQNLYKSKARADVAEVTNTVREIESQLLSSSQSNSNSTEPTPTSTQTPIPDSEIEQFCKLASHIRVLTNPKSHPIPTLRLIKSDPQILSLLPSTLSNWETISSVFIAMNAPYITEKVLTELLSPENDPDSLLAKSIQEIRRCEGAELHNTASVTGGMVSQEAIKLLTRQYIPVNGTCIWDGIRSRTEIVRF